MLTTPFTQDNQINQSDANTNEVTPNTNTNTTNTNGTMQVMDPRDTTTTLTDARMVVTPGQEQQTGTSNNQANTNATTGVNHGTNTATTNHSHNNNTTYNITFPVAETEGPLTKVCRLLGSSGNPMLGARLSQQVFEGMFALEANSTPETCILIFGDQPAPFPLLAVIKPDNKVFVLHGIKHLSIAFGVQHPNKGHTIAFVNDADQDTELPLS